MANLFFTLSCLGVMVSIVYGDNSECAPPPSRSQWKEESKCCQMPEIDIHLSSRKECFKELKATHPEFELKHHRPKWPESKNLTQCFEQCVFKKSSLLDASNKLNFEAIRKEGEKSMTGDWKEVGAKAVDECLKTAPSKVLEDAECESGSFEFGMCVTRHLFMNCPAEKWTESDVCKAAKTRLEKCADLPAPPPFHHHHGHHHDEHHDE